MASHCGIPVDLEGGGEVKVENHPGISFWNFFDGIDESLLNSFHKFDEENHDSLSNPFLIFKIINSTAN